MTDAKFCDIHVNPNNVVPKNRTMKIQLSRYDEKNQKYLLLFLDGCQPCITEKLLQVAKTFGVDVERSWKYEVLLRPNTSKNKSKKWRKTYMSPDEYREYQKEIDETYEEEEPVAERIPVETKTRSK